MTDTTLQQIIKLIADQTGINESDIRPEMQLVADIGCDSLDGIEIIMLTEELFEIEISDDEAERVATVHDIHRLVCEKTGKPAPTALPALKYKWLTLELPDGSLWGVPVELIANNRAAHYAHEFDGDLMRSLAEDTIPLFNSSDFDVTDWASNNMNWCDFNRRVVKLRDGKPLNPKDYWARFTDAEIGLIA